MMRDICIAAAMVFAGAAMFAATVLSRECFQLRRALAETEAASAARDRIGHSERQYILDRVGELSRWIEALEAWVGPRGEGGTEGEVR